MAREQVTTVPRRQAGGGHVACAPAAGRVSNLSTEAQAPARDNHRGQGMGHLQVYTHVTGVPRPSAHNAARSPDPESSLRGHCSQNRVGSATAVKTVWVRTSPHLQRWCDRGVDGPGAGDDGPPAAGEGGHVACAPAAGRVSDFSTEAQAPAHACASRNNHSGQGMGHLQVYTHVIGVPHPSAHNVARSPDPRKLLARPLQSKPRGLGRRLTSNGATVGWPGSR